MATKIKKPSAQKSPHGDRIRALRTLMQREKINAYLVPSADEHINEYLPEGHKRREYLSGFSGSAGDLLVTLSDAWVYADSRYYEQADSEVDLSAFKVSKMGLDGHPSLLETLKQFAKKQDKPVLGFDPYTMSYAQLKTFEFQLKPLGVTLKPVAGNLADAVWGDTRPGHINAPVFYLADPYTGQSVAEKLKAVRQGLKQAGASVFPVTKLDQIAWLFNLRGQDIPYNPVFMSYAIVTEKDAYLFTENKRVEATAKQNLSRYVQILPYKDYAKTLKALAQKTAVLIDPAHVTAGTVALLNDAKIVEVPNPVELLKAIKNEAELKWIREAHYKSSRSIMRLLHWIPQQERVTEKSAADALEKFYASEKEFMGLSFNTISGAGANSSIVHYGTPSAKKVLKPGDFYLVDSGAQYLGGTTDCTRTIIYGKPTALQKQRYTAVLKAHIACARQIFPKGTSGAKLDAITRAPLWQLQLDYGHGTGHGVGAYLNVHEGPQSISSRGNYPLMPGMVLSIEPGYYEPGWGGIRLENLYAVKAIDDDWYGFECLTWVPFDKRLIDFKALSSDELKWLENYHTTIFKKLGKTLAPSEARWLAKTLAF